MSKNRLEAFSDGVLAIIITIMVLDLKVPHGTDLRSLMPLMPVLMSYVLSFIYVGIYWNNHHHMLHTTKRISGGVLWANLHLLFWLSLLPFATSWMGENHFAQLPCTVYGVVLFMAAVAYLLLQQSIIAAEGATSALKHIVGADWKGKLSLVAYLVAIGASFKAGWFSLALYAFVAAMWLVPDQRIEKTISPVGWDEHGESQHPRRQ